MYFFFRCVRERVFRGIWSISPTYFLTLLEGFCLNTLFPIEAWSASGLSTPLKIDKRRPQSDKNSKMTKQSEKLVLKRI